MLLSLAAGAIRGWDKKNQFYFQILESLAALELKPGATVKIEHKTFDGIIKSLPIRGTTFSDVEFNFPLGNDKD